MKHNKQYDVTGNELREHKKYYGVSRFGKSTCIIKCPFCEERITAYIWSLSGCGKRCTCGVMHTSFNTSIDDKNIYGGRQTITEEDKKVWDDEWNELLKDVMDEDEKRGDNENKS